MTRTYRQAIKYAKEEGATAGHAAATWYEIKDAKRARIILLGIKDGDPSIVDTFPRADLSGEWADTLTGPQLLRDAYGVDDDEMTTNEREDLTDLCDAYEAAFDQAAQDEIERMARYHA